MLSDELLVFKEKFIEKAKYMVLQIVYKLLLIIFIFSSICNYRKKIDALLKNINTTLI